MSSPKCDISKNKYRVRVGTSLKFWESKRWITKHHPYGWVHWYCDFYKGKRGPDDERQIRRWKALAGPNGRFRKWLVTQVIKKTRQTEGTLKTEGTRTTRVNLQSRGWNNHEISPKIRQTLLHWGYELTKADFDREVSSRKKRSNKN